MFLIQVGLFYISADEKYNTHEKICKAATDA